MAIENSILQGYNVGAFIGDAVNIYSTVKGFQNMKKSGESTAVALGKSAGSFLAGEMYYSSLNMHLGSKVAGKVTGALARKGLEGGIKGIAAQGLGMAASFAVTMAPALLQTGAQLSMAYMENTTRIMNNAYAQRGRFGSGHFDMTEAGYTMRQRSLNAIRQNGLNTQSVLGNEARTYYRSSI